MDSELKERLTSGDLWVRALYMILFVIAYSVAEIVLTLLVLFQFVAILFTGSANEPLLRLGRNISTYIFQIIQFQTFNSEIKPFPFTDWPDEEPGENPWLDWQPSAPAAATAHPDDGPAAHTGAADSDPASPPHQAPESDEPPPRA